VVADVVDRANRHQIVAVLDDGAPPGAVFCGLPVLGGREQLAALARTGPHAGIVAIGDNTSRADVARRIAEAGLGFVTVVDPSAQVSRGVGLAPGTVVMPGVVVNTGTCVAEHVILNTSCSIDHDCRIEPHVHVSPGARVGGQCVLGRGCHIGIGASLVQGIEVGVGAVIGAGAAVVDDIPAGATAVGVPARLVPARRA
jgi:sugar O-acyltransferase (sialic acid O-acetyltransferase NeuD family)